MRRGIDQIGIQDLQQIQRIGKNSLKIQQSDGSTLSSQLQQQKNKRQSQDSNIINDHNGDFDDEKEQDNGPPDLEDVEDSPKFYKNNQFREGIQKGNTPLLDSKHPSTNESDQIQENSQSQKSAFLQEGQVEGSILGEKQMEMSKFPMKIVGTVEKLRKTKDKYRQDGEGLEEAEKITKSLNQKRNSNIRSKSVRINLNDNFRFAKSQDSNLGTNRSHSHRKELSKVEEIETSLIEKESKNSQIMMKAGSEAKDNKQNEIKIEKEQEQEVSVLESIQIYIEKINESIRISNNKLENFPQLLIQQRNLKLSIDELEQIFKSQYVYLRKLEEERLDAGNQKQSEDQKSKQNIIKGNKRDSDDKQELSTKLTLVRKQEQLVQYLQELIGSKMEQLSLTKEYEYVIEETNKQSRVCSEMGKTLIDFHQIISFELNQLKNDNQTPGSIKQQVGAAQESDQITKLDAQIKKLTLEKQILKDTLESRTKDFNILLQDAYEAKKLIQQQLIQIHISQQLIDTQKAEMQLQESKLKVDFQQRELEFKQNVESQLALIKKEKEDFKLYQNQALRLYPQELDTQLSNSRTNKETRTLFLNSLQAKSNQYFTLLYFFLFTNFNFRGSLFINPNIEATKIYKIFFLFYQLKYLYILYCNPYPMIIIFILSILLLLVKQNIIYHLNSKNQKIYKQM